MGAKNVVVFIDGFPFHWPASTAMAQFREDKYDREENIYMPLLGTSKKVLDAQEGSNKRRAV